MIAVIIAVLIACVSGWEFYFRKNWSKGLGVELHFSEPAVYAGGHVTLTEIIENRKRLPLHILEITFRTRKGLLFPDAENITESDYVYKRDVFSLLGMERIIRKYRVDAVRRGHYEISQTGALTFSIPGHRKHEKELDVTDDLYVYAKRTNVKGIAEEVTALLGEAESARKLYEDPFAFSGIRDYTRDDPMKSINWKATAKTGGLMVNTYTSVRSLTVRIFLDVEDRNIRKQQPLIEESISCAATLCEKLLKSGQPVSLFVNVKENGGTAAFESARGRGQQKAVERFLTTDFTTAETVDFAEFLGGIPEPKENASVDILISKNESLKLYERAKEMAGSGAGCVLVVPKERREELLYPSDGTLRVIRRAAV